MRRSSVASNEPGGNAIMAQSVKKDDAKKLRKYCREGNISKINEFFSYIDEAALKIFLNDRAGYTLIHEAVYSNKPRVIHYLKEKGANVNARADSGYTPLHLAASAGYVDCTKTLLECGADIYSTDDYGKTPKQTAGLSSKSVIVRLLRSEEIIKEVETNGDNLTELLRVRVDELEHTCLERALIAAVKNGNHFNVGKLVVKGATNVDNALQLSAELRKHEARAMLLLIKAAQLNDKDLVLKLFGAATSSNTNQFLPSNDDDFPEVQKAVISGIVSTVVPIEIARRYNSNAVREELLLRTDVNQEEGSVYWHGLRLLHLDLSWIRRIHWVKRLRLARNGFKSIPNEIGGYLQLVTKLDLQHNELTVIPKCLFELPSLVELNLSSNRLTKIPDVHEWSQGLTVLNLSNNELSFLPNDVIAPSICTLLIASNKFRTVPLCVCSFFSLQYLDISDNPDILSLPVEMGRLSNLNKLVLRGLIHLSDPPRNLQQDARDCIHYLNSKLRSARKCFHMKLIVVGNQDRGKTTLVSRVQGLEPSQNQSTNGVDVSEWNCPGGFGKKKYQFSVWDFAGEEEHCVISQCFFTERAMYLLLWNVKHGESGVNELKHWLDAISIRAPQSCVLIVGTHLDEVEDAERPTIDNLLNKVGELAGQYPRLQISEVLAVGLMNRLENIGLLREAIYECATKYKGRGSVPVMGQEIPASYFQLNKELEKIQDDVRKGLIEPVMHAEQFKDLVQKLKLPDICNNEELRAATLFLNEVGTILHYDDRSHSLNELYFIDPRWLCDMMSKIVTIQERNPFVKNGILHSKDIPLLFKDERFPWQYFEQYLTLLDQFEIALPLDNRRILIPSMLSEERPNNADLPDDPFGPHYQRYIVFQTPCPPGFWSRLISRIMHTVPEVCRALDHFHSFEEKNNDKVEQTFEFPNIEHFIVGDVNDSEPFNGDEVEIIYWKEGLVYKSPDLSFCVESLNQSKLTTRYSKGILLMASPSAKGTQTICHLVDMVLALIHEWYPGLEEGANPGVNGVQQRVPCYECLKLKRSMPFEFRIDEYMSIITSNRLKIECGYDSKNPVNNHVVSLADIMPDLLLKDLDERFLLKPEQIIYQEDKDSLLGEGGFGKVFRGKYLGKNVAIKKYITRSEDAFNELRGEAKFLQKLHHPCIVCLVGVSIHPSMALVLEEAPMGSLEHHLLKKRTPISRIVMFRMAAEVAAALRYLHQRGIIHRSVKTADVLLWSLEENSLFHCKLTDFGISTHLTPLGALGIQGSKCFIAPEVLFIGKKKAVYNHKADIFSFSMLLYQMIARRQPFHNVPPVKIDPKVVSGERPSIIDVHLAETGYYYLTRLMEQCWQDKPNKRLDTDELIAKLLDMTMISIMAITPVRSRFSLRRGCAITPHDFAKANASHTQSSELWICCDGSEGAELNIFDTNRMVKLSKNFIKDNQVQCMCVCGDHVWVCSRSGIEFGVIDIFSIISHELVHNIRMKENAVCCITAADDHVYLGTLEGYVFAFSMDVKKIQANDQRPQYKYISEYAVEGIVVTNKHVWASHTKFMSLLTLESLKMEHQLTRNDEHKDAFIGSLTYSKDAGVVWSAHLGGTIVSAWNANKQIHLYDIDTRKILLKNEKVPDFQDCDINMTSMTPVLDTQWVGMATGHIMVFHNQELMYFVRPYKECIRFLVPIPCEGPTGKEKCMVVSGGKGFNSPVPSCPAVLSEEEHESGVMILWEAFTKNTLRLMKALEKEGPSYLDNHTSVSNIIPFDSKACSQSDVVEATSSCSDMPTVGDSIDYDLTKADDGKHSDTALLVGDSIPDENTCTLPIEASSHDYIPVQPEGVFAEEAFDIFLDEDRLCHIVCPKPVQLDRMMNELESEMGDDVKGYSLVYFYYKLFEVNTQEALEQYLENPNKPKLMLIQK